MKFPVAKLVYLPCLSLGLVCSAAAAEAAAGWSLLPAVKVYATGLYFDQIVASASAEVPHLHLAPAPVAGRTLSLTTAQINDLLRQTAPELVTTNWTGAAQIKISRRTRQLTEAEIKELLAAALQQNYVKDKGDLELRFIRPVPSAIVVDEPLTVKILDLPSAGVTANFIARFELRAGEEIAGTWQIPTQAKIWSEVWVASSALKRGQLASEADLTRERRDLLTTRDPLTSIDLDNSALEIAENVPSGIPLTSRSLRLRAVVHRGKLADAIIRDGGMTLTLKVEILEDGIPGQTIRVRNLKSKREFRGKVQNEETILVSL